MKNLVFPSVALSVACMLLCSQITAQGGCTFITFAVQHIETCQYRIDYTNANECYPQLRVLLSEGSYASWNANAPDGWTATLVNGGEILLTHSSGFIPIGTGTPLTFTLSPGSNPVLTLLWDYTCPPGEGCFAEFQLEGCPVIADGCIEGFVYQECNELPFIDQETLAERTVELVDEFGSILESELTGADGAYSFCDLPAGTYEVRVTPKEGWTPRVPASGKATITLNPSEFAEQNFGYCPDCACGSFTDMFVRTARGGFSQSVSCGNASVALSCPSSGEGYVLSGLFHCDGDSCAEENRLDWTLTGPLGTYSASTKANPYFSIHFQASLFSQAGVYTIRLGGHCGTASCPCLIRLNIDCTDLCPCSSEDVEDFAARVERGFAMIYPENSCMTCFSPIAINDCETVEWFLNSPGGSPIGSSIGARTFCYQFPEQGSYNVVMEVSKKKDDGSNCDKQMRIQSVVPCHAPPGCIDPFIDNPDFDLGAQAGGLNSGGMTRGWVAANGEPSVIEGALGSADGWTIQLSGNLDTADVLSRSELICLGKGVPATCSTTVKSSKSNSSERISGGTLRIYIGSMEVFDINLQDCQSPDCYELASVQLPVLDSSVWIDVVVPYDLSGWEHAGDCDEGAGILVRPYVFVTNYFGSNQGGEGTYSFAELDNICFNAQMVALDDLDTGHDFNIYPNPNNGNFTVELAEAAQQGLYVKVIGVAGEVVLTRKVITGTITQNIDADKLSPGMYLLQIVLEGRVLAVKKFVKQ